MVRVPKMVLHYTMMFAVPTGIMYYYWKPESEEELREKLEKRHPPDLARRQLHQQKFAELLLRTDKISDETKKQVDQVTDFTPKTPGFVAKK